MGGDIVYLDVDRRALKDIKYIRLKTILSTVGSISTGVLQMSLLKLIGAPQFKGKVSGECVRYLYASAFLSFAGREINKKSLSSVLKSVGIKPKEECINTFLKTGIESHLVYLYAYYFLLANRLAASDENMSGVIKSLGMKPDKERINAARGFVRIYPFTPAPKIR